MRARLVVLDGPDAGRTFELDERATVGRAPDCEVRLHGGSVSRHHATLEWSDGAWQVRDLGSKNGLRMGGRRCRHARLVDQDEFLLGEVRLRLQASARAARTARAGGDPQGSGEVVLEEEIDLDALETSQRPGLASVWEPPERVPRRSGGVFRRDLSQYPVGAQLLVLVVLLALAGGLAWAAYRAVAALRAGF